MPINTRELLDAVAIVTDKANMRVAMKESAKGGAICGSACMLGGLLAGPVGLAVGGTLGGLAAAYMSQGKFKSVAEIIRDDLSVMEKEQLKDKILYALSDFQVTDVAVLLPLLLGNARAQQAVLSTVVSFVTNEMRMQIID